MMMSNPPASRISAAARVALASPPVAPRVAMLRMKTPGSSTRSVIRMRSPRIAPPENGLDGSIAITPTRRPSARIACTSLLTNVDLPLPGTPVMPMICARPAALKIAASAPRASFTPDSAREINRPRATVSPLRMRSSRSIDGTGAPMSRLLQLLIELAKHFSIIHHAPRLEVGARKRVRLDHLHHRAHRERLQDPLLHGLLELLAALRVARHFRGRLDADQQFVHRTFACDHDAMLAAVLRQRVQHRVDLARIDVLAADREHVVDAPEDALRQARIGASARRRTVLPHR